MTKAHKAVHALVLKGNMPSRDVAAAIGKPYSTLMRELNPDDRLAKLGLDTFVDILKATGGIRPLEVMAEELGYGLVPLQ